MTFSPKKLSEWESEELSRVCKPCKKQGKQMRSQKIIPFLTVHLYVAMKSSTDWGGGEGRVAERKFLFLNTTFLLRENRDDSV